MYRALIIALCLTLSSSANAEERPADKKISIEFERTNIENVFRAFGELMHLNIVLHPSIRGTVSLRLNDTPTGECFVTLLRLKGLYAIKEGNIVLVYPLDTLPGE